MNDKIIQIESVTHPSYVEPILYGLGESGSLYYLNEANFWTLIEPKKLENED